ncbi:hypothetical protein [Burkholderia guangdongensis]|uniref:hypothetical protein n=1 Tax=Burkholderia guangdongensis TaxID=1792500 RepID=UPI0015C80DC7|nr:hypothetical protein [Burkholderia guangdongensis]
MASAPRPTGKAGLRIVPARELALHNAAGEGLPGEWTFGCRRDTILSVTRRV